MHFSILLEEKNAEIMYSGKMCCLVQKWKFYYTCHIKYNFPHRIFKCANYLTVKKDKSTTSNDFRVNGRSGGE